MQIPANYGRSVALAPGEWVHKRDVILHNWPEEVQPVYYLTRLPNYKLDMHAIIYVKNTKYKECEHVCTYLHNIKINICNVSIMRLVARSMNLIRRMEKLVMILIHIQNVS